MARIVSISSNADEIARQFGEVAREQIPFATALALTSLAFEGRKASQTELQRSLTTRNRYSATGVQVNPAEKASWPNMQSEVGIEKGRSYLIDHVTAGKRDGGTHGRAIIEDETQRTSSGRVPKGKRPAALIAKAIKARAKAKKRNGQDKRLPFLFYSRKWGNEVLAQRTSDERYPLQILYAFRKGVSIKRQFEMDLAVERTVQANYAQAFDKALRRAIATGKSKGERQASDSRGQAIDSGR